MTPYGAEPAFRNRVLSGKVPWSRATMAALFYWCVLGTTLLSAHVARAEIEFYPDERPSSSTGPHANMPASSRVAPQAEGRGSDGGQIAPLSSLDNDESTQRQLPFNMGVPINYNQRMSAEMYNQAKMEERKEMRRLQDEEAMRQQMQEEEILQRMILQATRLGELRRKLISDQDGLQRMQVRHRGNYPESSMEKPVPSLPVLSQPSPYIYADSRLKDIFSPLSNHRFSDSPSLRDLAGMTDEKMPDADFSMDRGADSPDVGGDVQHIFPFYGSAVPIGLLPSHTGVAAPPQEPKYPSQAAGSPSFLPLPTPSPRSKSRSSFYGSNIIQMEDGTVAKKVLRMPDHWFLGMPDVYKLAIVIGCSVMGAGAVIGGLIWQYRLHRRAKAAADVDYPAYGVTGPSRDLSPSGDRRLAQSAQIYHYQHQKQQILSMEGGNQPPSRGSMSEAESEDENEEGDYTVYECPGLAPPGEMEVKNPMFDDDPTTATPTPATPGSTTVGRDEGRSKNNKGSPSSK